MKAKDSLALKYRPKTLKSFMAPASVTNVVRGMLSSDIIKVIMISGPTGSGKTTLARILAAHFNCPNLKDLVACQECPSCTGIYAGKGQDVHELNGASERGIDAAKQLAINAQYAPRGDFRVFILDECFPAETLVMIDYNSAIPIEDVVTNEAITHVLAYDLEKKQIVKKKIIGRMRKPCYDTMVTVTISGHKIRCTSNHPFYVVGKGYVAAAKLSPMDQVIVYDGAFSNGRACHICDAIVDSLATHMMVCHRDVTTHQSYTESLKGTKHDKAWVDKCRVGSLRFQETEAGAVMRDNASSRQRGSNNTVFRHSTPEEVALRLGAQSRKWWASLSPEDREVRIKRFMKAPIHRKSINNVEQAVVDMNITGLTFVGDGKLFMPLTMPDGTYKHKNPDFVYKEDGEVKKIVEVMDFVYWHTRDEAEQVKQAYAQIGYDCLVVDAARIKTNLTEVRGELEAFCNNHFAVVDSVVSDDNPSRGKLVFDIEVEDVHNFFVVPAADYPARPSRSPITGRICSNPKDLGKPVLVHNCHMLTPQAWQSLLKVIEEPSPNTVFIICTSEPQALPPTILTRHLHLKLKPHSPEAIMGLLGRVASKEGVDFTKETYEKIAQASEGSARLALMTLESCMLARLGGEKSPDVAVDQAVRQATADSPNKLARAWIKALHAGDAVTAMNAAVSGAEFPVPFIDAAVRMNGHFLRGMSDHEPDLYYKDLADLPTTPSNIVAMSQILLETNQLLKGYTAPDAQAVLLTATLRIVQAKLAGVQKRLDDADDPPSLLADKTSDTNKQTAATVPEPDEPAAVVAGGSCLLPGISGATVTPETCEPVEPSTVELPVRLADTELPPSTENSDGNHALNVDAEVKADTELEAGPELETTSVLPSPEFLASLEDGCDVTAGEPRQYTADVTFETFSDSFKLKTAADWLLCAIDFLTQQGSTFVKTADAVSIIKAITFSNAPSTALQAIKGGFIIRRPGLQLTDDGHARLQRLRRVDTPVQTQPEA